jgi:hypothetical protein
MQNTKNARWRTIAKSWWRSFLDGIGNVDYQVEILRVVRFVRWEVESFVANERRIPQLVGLAHHCRDTFRHAVSFLGLLEIWVVNLKPTAIAPLGEEEADSAWRIRKEL